MTLPSPAPHQIVKTRLIHLDLLRGIAILLVLGPHLPRDSPEMSVFLKLWHRGGWCGVDLFFVLSGFLIGGLLFDEYLKTGAIHIGRFIIRRGFKIWPSYFVFLLFEFFNLLTQAPGGISIRLKAVLGDMWPNFLHVQNYVPTPFPLTWSLAVEEHFYLLLPLALLVMTKSARFATSQNRFRRLPVLFACVAAFCMIARILTAWLIQPFNPYIHFFPTHLRMDSLMTGVVLAYLVRFHAYTIARLRRYRILIFAVCTALFVPPFAFDLGSSPWTYSIWPAALALGSAGLVLLAHSASLRNPRSSNPMIRLISWVGIYSYSIYLWHEPLAQWISHQIPAHGWPGGIAPIAAGYTLLAILLGALMYRIIEYPTLSVRDRFFPRPVTIPQLIPASGISHGI